MRKSILALIACCLLFAGEAIGAGFENESPMIRDVTGNLSAERFETLAGKVDATFTKVLQYRSADPRSGQFGKITVEFDRPAPRLSAQAMSKRP